MSVLSLHHQSTIGVRRNSTRSFSRFRNVDSPSGDHRSFSSSYSRIMIEDNETSELVAKTMNSQQIKEEIEMLLGSTKEWDSGKEESSSFRESMKHAKKIVTENTYVLPPVYVTNDPLPPTYKGSFKCRIHLDIDDTKVKTMVICKGEMTADDFAIFFLNKINTSLALGRQKDDWVFKASGTAEYLYGDVKMINFEHIRRCLAKDQIVELTLLNKRKVEEEIEMKDVKIHKITYEFETSHYLFNHDELKMLTKSWSAMECISLWDLHRPFRVRILGTDNLTPNLRPQYVEKLTYDPTTTSTYVKIDLFHGAHRISNSRFSRAIPFTRYVRWNQWVEFPNLLLSELPRETKICLTVYAKKFKRNKPDPMQTSINGDGYCRAKDVPLAYVNYPLIDHKGELRTGGLKLRMWPDEASQPQFASVQNVGTGGLADDSAPCCITFELDTFCLPVMFPQGEPPQELQDKFRSYEEQQRVLYSFLSNEELDKEIERIIDSDPLYTLNEEEMWRIWDSREKLKTNSKALPKFLASVPSRNPHAIFISHKLLKEWAPMEPIDSIELLDYHYGDACVREYAVKMLNRMDDNELSDFILQLVQTLKYEPYHDSSLSRFLLQRGLQCTHLIGHILFWHLKGELHVPYIRERYGLILEEYLCHCGAHRKDLLKQNGIVKQLYSIAMKVKEAKKAEIHNILRSELVKLVHPPKFKLPLSPRLEVSGILPEKCKVMDSKKLPLWLVFENADSSAPPIYVMFKAGDDIRQDLLTLQMLKTMDKRWKQEGLDLHMQPYGCVCLGDMIGMIEIVLNSDTIANITSASGGATAAFSDTPLTEWLKVQNPKLDLWDNVVNNFVYSCAGYCVATYVLGIGDRHNDNIMLTKKGDLFHIDFGHFLGHFKTFKGIYKRETSPFVFTPMYAHVMGGEGSDNFVRFADLASRAFNIIRKHGKMIMNLFLLMLATGIPELRSIEDVLWLRKCLVLEKNPDEAAQHFRDQIKKSLNNTKAQINDYIHIVAHK